MTSDPKNAITLTSVGNIAKIIVDDGKVNALDNDWFKYMLDMLDAVEASDAEALVLKGRDGIFSGGLNIKWLPTMSSREAVEFKQLFSATMKRLYFFSKPTIAQITGHAIAGGCIMACACDRRLAISGARIAMNEVRANMTVPIWAIDIVTDVIPQPTSKLMLKFGDPVTSDELAELGVIEAIYDTQDDLDEAALAMARGFEGISLSDFAGTKMRVRNQVRQ